MRLVRPSAFILAVFTAALVWAAVWHMTPDLSTRRPMVNESMHGRMANLDLAKDAARFRCDSLVAEDCFEMFHRHTTNAPASAAPFMPKFDFGNTRGVARMQSDACSSDVMHRGDRCLTRESR
jgi:hypothetical protein